MKENKTDKEIESSSIVTLNQKRAPPKRATHSTNALPMNFKRSQTLAFDIGNAVIEEDSDSVDSSEEEDQFDDSKLNQKKTMGSKVGLMRLPTVGGGSKLGNMMKFGQNLRQGTNIRGASSMKTAHMVRQVFSGNKNDSSVLESSLSGISQDEEQIKVVTELIETKLKDQKNQLEKFHSA